MIEPVALTVPLPSADVGVSAAYEGADDARAVLVLAHGAGSRYDSPFLVGLARGLARRGIGTLRFNFAYAEAGRRMPGPAAHAIAAWRAADAFARERAGGAPVWAGGRSYGGRMASMSVAQGAIEPAGLVYLGYPLHPPGRPDRPRAEHLPRIAAPQLFLSGTNDPFVDPHEQLEEAVAACPDAELVWVDGGGHGFEVKGRRRPADAIGADLAATVADWIVARQGIGPT